MGNYTKKGVNVKVHILRYNILRIDIPCCLFKQKPNKYLYHKAMAPYSSGKPTENRLFEATKACGFLKVGYFEE